VPPWGNADGCEYKGLAGKAIRKVVKTKEENSTGTEMFGAKRENGNAGDGWAGPWRMVARRVRVSKGIYIEWSNSGVERQLRALDLASVAMRDYR
jgi:hypothetical protein